MHSTLFADRVICTEGNEGNEEQRAPTSLPSFASVRVLLLCVQSYLRSGLMGTRVVRPSEDVFPVASGIPA